MTKEELYRGMVVLCQEFGFTTEHTYDLLHQVVDSIQQEDPEPNVFTLVVDGGIATLIDPADGDNMPIAEGEGETPDEAVRNLMDKVTFDTEGANPDKPKLRKLLGMITDVNSPFTDEA